ncbi:Lon protease family protein [Sediminimonas qiaohouensis]|uniref:Lon protease family protein n=1 Tax=Sediminimonas qiaohouensis TaxID=552061 RepID=UPI000424EBC9|nr:AAA family ATPase [Sediminimonas qiaohouensis]
MAHKISPKELSAHALAAPIAEADFDFKTTDDLEEMKDWFGQERSVDAIRMAATIQHSDFNAFVLGTPGSGRHTITQSILSDTAKDAPCPSDWVYVNNFEAPHKPIAIELPPGGANRLRAAMEALIDELANDIPALFESETYRTQRRSIEDTFTSGHEEAMSEVFEKARTRKVAILRTPMGFTFAGLQNGEVMSQEQYENLSEEDRKALEEAIEKTQKELSAVLRDVPKQEKDHRRKIEELNYSMASQGVDEAIGDVKEAFSQHKPVQDFLEAVRDDLIENAELFLQREDGAEAGPFPVATTKHYAKAQFQRYTVNVIVAHDEGDTGAPVVKEDLPTLANLIGRIEYASQMGALVTNFTMIKPGALHRANGGYLILDALQVLSEPLAWDALKRSLRAGEISIYSPGERLSMISTVSLDPDPVPLKTRVILIGERLHYYLLSALDPDFKHLFKLEADFNDQMPLADDAKEGYARLIATLARRAGGKALDTGAVARLFGESMRTTGDAERLTLNTSHLSDIIKEAGFWADKRDAKQIAREDIDKVIIEREYRAGRVRELSQEMILRDTVMIDTEGQRAGQINALSVMQIGGYMFGRPSRLTARTRPGTGKLIDIEREIELGGPLHSKGMLILQGYLAASYATKAPMSLWASLVFEQSYGGVDGDSASAAELIALLSSLAEAPIDQSFAITGSVNQFGDIQPIGGVNEKIEGFFDICAERGLSGRQGVLIPAANTKNLCLRKRVIDAVEQGKFHIIPMRTVNDGLEVLTGMDAGERGEDGAYPEGSLNRRVEDRLSGFADIRKTFVSDARHGNSNDRS